MIPQRCTRLLILLGVHLLELKKIQIMLSHKTQLLNSKMLSHFWMEKHVKQIAWNRLLSFNHCFPKGVSFYFFPLLSFFLFFLQVSSSSFIFIKSDLKKKAVNKLKREMAGLMMSLKFGYSDVPWPLSPLHSLSLLRDSFVRAQNT